MSNLELYEKFRAVPDNAKKQIKGGRISGMTDINPMWRIKALTEQFGPCGIGWYYVPTRKWLETAGDEVCAFVDIELFVKHEGGWSMPIVGNGGSKLATKEKNGIFVSDECYKMATTDALSVACKQLGIGADVYFEKDTTKYTQQKPSVAQQKPKASDEQIQAIRDLCDKWKVDILYLYTSNDITESTITKETADGLIDGLNKKFEGK